MIGGRQWAMVLQVDVCDVEQLVVTGKQMKACPYYGTRYAIPSAQVCWSSSWLSSEGSNTVYILFTGLLLRKDSGGDYGVKHCTKAVNNGIYKAHNFSTNLT